MTTTYASFALAIWTLLACLFGAFALCLLTLELGRVLGGRSHGRVKNLPFESGVSSAGLSCLRFSVKYALVAMLFVIFDVEIPFLYLQAVLLRENGWAGFIEATPFVPLLLAGLFYLYRVGALDWSPKRRWRKPHDQSWRITSKQWQACPAVAKVTAQSTPESRRSPCYRWNVYLP